MSIHTAQREIKRLRTNAGLTLRQFGAGVGFSHEQVRRIESGEQPFYAERCWPALALILEIDIRVIAVLALHEKYRALGVEAHAIMQRADAAHDRAKAILDDLNANPPSVTVRALGGQG